MRIPMLAVWLLALPQGVQASDESPSRMLKPRRVVSWEIDPSAATSGTRCLFKETGSRLLTCSGRGVGWGQETRSVIRFGMSGRIVGTSWCVGAEHAIAMPLKKWGGDKFSAEIIGDPTFPLTFKVGRDGYYYLCGRGTFTLAGNEPVQLGQDIPKMTGSLH